MKPLLMLYILNLLSHGWSVESQSPICPAWMYLNFKTNQCVCGISYQGFVICEPYRSNMTVLEDYYCIYFSEKFNTTLIGNCPYAIGGLQPQNVTQLKENVGKCSYLHRKGPLCGECESGYTLPVYSYDLGCVRCKDYKYRWIKFIAVAFIPLTIFYVLLIMLRISATSPALNGYILVSQIISTPALVRKLFTHNCNDTLHLVKPLSNFSKFSVRLFVSVYTIWNLDFFRSFYNPICLYPNLTYQDVLLLDYAVAVYPLFLILITFVMIKLHDNFAIVVWLWRPFHKCLFLFRKQWNIRSYLVNALTTFIVLSYVKILNVSFEFLTPSHVYNMNGQIVSNAYWYYDGRVNMTSKEYLPYLLLALFMLLIFNVLPMVLLALYPFECFQRLLSCCCSMRCKLALQIYMDTFHGCYAIEDRTHDNRHFATLYLAVRFINLLLLSFFHYYLYFTLAAFLVALTLTLVARFQPYKDKRSNTVDIVLLFALLFTCVYMLLGKYTADQHLLPHHLRRITILVLLLIPPGYLTFLIVTHLGSMQSLKIFLLKSKTFLLRWLNCFHIGS